MKSLWMAYRAERWYIMNSKQITLMSLLTAVSLVLSAIESLIPPPFPIPGIKLGLANIITVYAMFTLGAKPTLMILLTRITLGGLFTGRVVSVLYSLTGGLFCYVIMFVVYRKLNNNYIWVCSILAAIFHNLGQIIIALIITQTKAILVYLPFLMLSGILTGLAIGIIAQLIVNRLPHPR